MTVGLNLAESASNLTISGTTAGVENGQIVSVVLHGHTYTGTVTSNAWSVTAPAADLAHAQLPDGGYLVTANVSDLAGNPATQAQTALIVDETAPSTPVLALGTGVSNGATASEATQPGGVVTVSDEAGSTIVVTFTNGVHTVTKTVTGTGSPQAVTLTSGDLTTLTNGTISVSANATDAAGNTSSAGTTSFVLDTVAPADTWTYLTSSKAITVTTDLSGIASVTAVDNTHPAQGFAAPINNGGGSWTIATSPTTNINGDSVTVTVTDNAGNVTISTHTAPAGVAGEAINLGLTDPLAGFIGVTTVTVAGVPSGWTLSEGTDNGDGSWTVVTNDIASLSITQRATPVRWCSMWRRPGPTRTAASETQPSSTTSKPMRQARRSSRCRATTT